MGRHTILVALAAVRALRAVESPAGNPVGGPLPDAVIADDPLLDLLRDDE